MAQVAIVTDSTASIPEDCWNDLHIHTVPTISIAGRKCCATWSRVQRDEFLRWMMTATTLPTTASPGPGDYFETYQDRLSRATEEIICIHMTSNGSGAYQAASVARETMMTKIPDVRIEVVDTRNVSLCQGWMVIEAGPRRAGRSHSGRDRCHR